MMHLEALYWVVSENTKDRLFENILIDIEHYNTVCMAFTCVLDVSIVGIGIGFVGATPSCNIFFFQKFTFCTNIIACILTILILQRNCFSFSEMV